MLGIDKDSRGKLLGGSGVDCLAGPAVAEVSKVVLLVTVAERSPGFSWLVTGLVGLAHRSVAGPASMDGDTAEVGTCT